MILKLVQFFMNQSLNEEPDLNGSKGYVFNTYLNLNTSYEIKRTALDHNNFIT
jgi:hypothetical protein